MADTERWEARLGPTPIGERDELSIFRRPLGPWAGDSRGVMPLGVLYDSNQHPTYGGSKTPWAKGPAKFKDFLVPVRDK